MENELEAKKTKDEILEDIKIAIKELNFVLAGKIEARDADDLLGEL